MSEDEVLRTTSSHRYGTNPTNILNNEQIIFCNHGGQELCTLHTTSKLICNKVQSFCNMEKRFKFFFTYHENGHHLNILALLFIRDF